jgi:hypothetical protein
MVEIVKQHPPPFVVGLPAPVSDDVIDLVVRELNSFQHRASLEVALGMGKIIVDRFYEGDLTAWRMHKTKEVSFRKLARRSGTDLSVSATFLYRAVALYEMARRLGARKMSNLTATHLRVILGLPAEKQGELIAAAQENRWSSERLEREAVKERVNIGKRTGRPSSPLVLKIFRRVVKDWKQFEEIVNQESACGLSSEEVRSLYTAVDDLKHRLEKVGRRICHLSTSAPPRLPADLGCSEVTSPRRVGRS